MTSRLRWLLAGLPTAAIYASVTFVLLTTLYIPYAVLVGSISTLVLAPLTHRLTRHFHDHDRDTAIPPHTSLRETLRRTVAPRYALQRSHTQWHLILTALIVALLTTAVLVGVTGAQLIVYANGGWTIFPQILSDTPLNMVVSLGGFFPLGNATSEMLAAAANGFLLAFVLLATIGRGLSRPALYATATDQSRLENSRPGAAAAWHALSYPRRDPLGAAAALIMHLVVFAVFAALYWGGHMALIVQPATGAFGVSYGAIHPAPIGAALGYTAVVFTVMLGVEAIRRFVDAHIHARYRERADTTPPALIAAVDGGVVVRWLTIGLVVAVVLSSAAAGVRVTDHRPYNPASPDPGVDPAADPLTTVDTAINHLRTTGWTMNATASDHETHTMRVAPNASRTALPPTASPTQYDSRLVWRSYVALDRTDNELAIIRQRLAATNAGGYDPDSVFPATNTSLFQAGAQTYHAPNPDVPRDAPLTGESVPRDAWTAAGAATPVKGGYTITPPPSATHLGLMLGSRPYGLIWDAEREAHLTTTQTTSDTVTYTASLDTDEAPTMSHGATTGMAFDDPLLAVSSDRDQVGNTTSGTMHGHNMTLIHAHPATDPVVVRSDALLSPANATQRLQEYNTDTVHVITNRTLTVTVDRETGRFTRMAVERTAVTYMRPTVTGTAESPEVETMTVTRHQHQMTLTFDGYGGETITHKPPEPNPVTNTYLFMADVIVY